ncbi:MAG: tetratricopeptide repeat protein, partial [Anaerolineae bacterium]
ASRTLVNILSTYQNTGAWDKVLGMAEEAYQAQTAVSYRQGMAAVRQAEGLAACMLGDFAAARQAINQAMAGFEAAGDQIGIGIALDALGLIAEREGKLAEAADYFRQAIRIAQAANAATFAAYARQDLGILCVQMGDFDDAIPLLEAAVATWRTSGDQLNSLKCEACLALSRLEKGQQAQAKQLADSGWSAFQAGSVAGEEPQVWLWTLHRLMQNLNCHMEADQILEAAYSELQTQAQAISNHEMRRRFFTDVPTNREIVAALGKTQQIEVTLARKDAPLGRPLTPDEKATIQWTLTAPEDETITAKSDRRRFRLLRLVREADAQDAAPTDDDLAQALGVSRRTVLRDMEALRATGGSLPTRRRGND